MQPLDLWKLPCGVDTGGVASGEISVRRSRSRPFGEDAILFQIQIRDTCGYCWGQVGTDRGVVQWLSRLAGREGEMVEGGENCNFTGGRVDRCRCAIGGRRGGASNLCLSPRDSTTRDECSVRWCCVLTPTYRLQRGRWARLHANMRRVHACAGAPPACSLFLFSYSAVQCSVLGRSDFRQDF